MRAPLPWRLLRRLLPRRLRLHHGDELLALYRRRWAGSSRRAFWLRVAADVAWTAGAARWEALGSGTLPVELRHAWRGLSRPLGPTAGAIATAAVGVAGVALLSAAVRTVLLEPLPVRDEAAVRVLWNHDVERGHPHVPFMLREWESARELDAWASVTAVDAAGTQAWPVEGPDGPEPLRRARVVGDFFGTLGVPVAAGRPLRPEEDRPGADGVAVVSHGLWHRRWGGAPEAVGAVLESDGRRWRVVGVAPEGFDYPVGADVWIPTRQALSDFESSRSYLELDLVTRLAPGWSEDDAVAALASALAEPPGRAEVRARYRIVRRTLRDATVGSMRPTLLLLLGAALLSLAVAGADAFHLLAARGAARARGHRVRRAVGAARRDVARLVVLESLLMGVAAAALAVLLAVAAAELLLPLAPDRLPRLDRVRVDGPTAAICLVLCGAGLPVLAVAATWRSLREPEPGRWTDSATAGTRPGGVGAPPGAPGLLIGAQAALGVLALAAAGLLGDGLQRVRSLDPGFPAEGLHAVRLAHGFTHMAMPPDAQPRFRALERAVAARPGVEGATVVLAQPLAGNGGIDVVVRLPGQAPEEAVRNPYLSLEVIGPGYPAVVGVGLVEGRWPEQGAAEVAVSARAAAAYWPGKDALGRSVGSAVPGAPVESWTVVGVAEDTRYREFLEPRPTLYAPVDPGGTLAPGWLLVRAAAGTDVRRAVEAAAREAFPEVRAVQSFSLAERLGEPLVVPRFAAAVAAALGAVTLLLAVAGIYGVTAVRVAGRRRELAVRTALGAAGSALAVRVVGRAAGHAALGVLAGGACAWWVARLAAARFPQTDPTLAWTLLLPAGAVLGSAAAAALGPALRAAATDPAAALREG